MTDALDLEDLEMVAMALIGHAGESKSLAYQALYAAKAGNFDEAANANHSLFNNFFHYLLENGIYLPPSGYETWFISDAIKENEIDRTLEVIRKFEYS